MQYKDYFEKREQMKDDYVTYYDKNILKREVGAKPDAEYPVPATK